MVKKQPTFLYKFMWSLMVSAFLFAATPHEFIHDLLETHKDTVDYPHQDIEVSKIHTHCDFLTESLSPTIPGRILIFDFCLSLHYLYIANHITAVSQQPKFHYSLRGPPLTFLFS